MAEKDFQYYKKWALGVLKKQYDALDKKEKENKKVSKAFSLAEKEMEKAFPVGTIRTWKGKKFIKSPDKKWRPYYEKNDTTGAKRTLSLLAKKINALDDGDFKGLYNLLKLHESRFLGEGNQLMEIYKLAKEKGAKTGGRFKVARDKAEKNAVRVVSKEELHDFIQEQRNSPGDTNPKVSLGNISEDVKKRIKEKTGIEANRFIVDGSGIRHAFKKQEHNLEPNDLDDMKNILNTATHIELSGKDRIGQQCITFFHPVENNFVLVEEFRIKNKDLALKTAYRMKEKRNANDGNKAPMHTSETFRATKNISQNDEKSSEKESETKKEDEAVKKDITNLNSVFKNKGSFSVNNSELGDIEVPYDKEGKGLRHIIERRYEEMHNRKRAPIKDKNEIKNRIATLLVLLMDAIKHGNTEKQNRPNTWTVKKEGITAIVAQRKGKFLLTGFEDKTQKEKAADSIIAGIANYRYVHGFPELYDHVGAVIDSISDSGEKSSEKETKANLPKIEGIDEKEIKAAFEGVDEKDRAFLASEIDKRSDFNTFKNSVKEGLDNYLKYNEGPNDIFWSAKQLKYRYEVVKAAYERNKRDAEAIRRAWESPSIIKEMGEGLYSVQGETGQTYKDKDGTEKKRLYPFMLAVSKEEVDQFERIKSRVAPIACKHCDRVVSLLKDEADFLKELYTKKKKDPSFDARSEGSYKDFEKWQKEKGGKEEKKSKKVKKSFCYFDRTGRLWMKKAALNAFMG